MTGEKEKSDDQQSDAVGFNSFTLEGNAFDCLKCKLSLSGVLISCKSHAASNIAPRFISPYVDHEGVETASGVLSFFNHNLLLL